MPAKTRRKLDRDRGAAAILVVKGAGLQRYGDTLDLFVRGFWPAVQSIDGTATLRAIGDEDAAWPAEASDPGTRRLCILSTHGRVLIGEVDWEVALRPTSAVTALSRAWTMATAVLRSRLSALARDPTSAEDGGAQSTSDAKGGTRGAADDVLRFSAAHLWSGTVMYFFLLLVLWQPAQLLDLGRALSPVAIALGATASAVLAGAPAVLKARRASMFGARPIEVDGQGLAVGQPRSVVTGDGATHTVVVCAPGR